MPSFPTRLRSLSARLRQAGHRAAASEVVQLRRRGLRLPDLPVDLEHGEALRVVELEHGGRLAVVDAADVVVCTEHEVNPDRPRPTEGRPASGRRAHQVTVMLNDAEREAWDRLRGSASRGELARRAVARLAREP